MLRLDFDGTASSRFDDFVPAAPKIDSLKTPPADLALNDELIVDLRRLCEDASQMHSKENLVALLEALAQSSARISLTEPTVFLKELEAALNQLHANLNLWRFSISLEDDCMHLWDKLLSCYLRLPERFVAVFDRSDLEISIPRLFFRKIFGNVNVLRQGRPSRCTERLLNKLLACGFQDEFFIDLIRLDLDGQVTKVLVQSLSLSRKIDFSFKISVAMELVCDGIESMSERMSLHVVPIVVADTDTIAALFSSLIQYQTLSSTAMSVIIATLCWLHLDRIPVSAILKDIFSEKRKQSPFLTHLSLVLLSFVGAADLQADLDLIGRITTKLSSCLGHPEPRVRLMAQVIAEAFARLSGGLKPLYFELDEDNEEVLEFRRTETMARRIDRVLHPGIESVAYKFQKPELEGRAEPMPLEDYQQISLAPSREASLSLFDSELKSTLPPPSSTEPRNSKVRTPRFLKDCWDYVNSEDPEKWEASLNALPSVIVNSYQIELREVGPQVFKTLLFLSDQYKLAGFESQRMQLLANFMSRIPENCLRMLKCEFVGRSLNLGQKSEILTLVMMALKDQLQLTAGNGSSVQEIDQIFSALKLSDAYEPARDKEHLSMPVLIRHFYLPLLGELGSTRSKVFATAHDFLLEKTILCLSMFFYLSGMSHLCIIDSL